MVKTFLMSREELMGGAILRFQEAKETLATREAQVERITPIFEAVLRLLRSGTLPDIDLEREFPTYQNILELRDAITQARKQLESAKTEVERFGINSAAL